jgi:ankyrin repeat protein
VFTVFCWFAPEVQRLDEGLFNYILGSMAAYDGRSPALSNFLRLYKLFKADDWKLLKESTCFGFTPDWAVVAIARDEVAVLQQNREFTAHYLAPPCVFDCSPIIDPGTPMLHVAAFFGSIKCFDYLLMKGADAEAVSQRGATLTHYAIAGGNPEMIRRVLEMEVDKKGVFRIAAKFHQNELVDYFLEHFSDASEDPWQELFSASVEGNNLTCLLKCIEHGVRVNETDLFEVRFLFKNHHFFLPQRMGISQY